MSEEGGRGTIGLVRPKVSLLLAGLGIWALMLPLSVQALATGVHELLLHLLTLGAFGGWGIRHAFSSTKGARIVHDRLTIDGRELRFGRRHLARRADLAQGFLVPLEDGILVRLERRGPRPPIFLSVRDEETGRALLRELGLDAERVTAEMRIASLLDAMSVGRQVVLMLVLAVGFFAAVMAALAVFGSAASHALSVLTVALIAFALGIGLAPTSVRIGTDGILSRWLGRRRFVPFARITSASAYDETVGVKRRHGVRLVLADGEIVRLPTGQTDLGAAEARRLLRRIEDARAARDAGARPVDVLDRGRRSFVDWVRELRRMGAGAQGHRAAAVPAEVLLRVVEDGAAPAVDRASAAVAVVAGSDPDAKRRVRVAAEATASPQLRIALTRIAETSGAEDDAALASTLEQLDEERQGRASR